MLPKEEIAWRAICSEGSSRAVAIARSALLVSLPMNFGSPRYFRALEGRQGVVPTDPNQDVDRVGAAVEVLVPKRAPENLADRLAAQLYNQRRHRGPKRGFRAVQRAAQLPVLEKIVHFGDHRRQGGAQHWIGALERSHERNKQRGVLGRALDQGCEYFAPLTVQRGVTD